MGFNRSQILLLQAFGSLTVFALALLCLRIILADSTHYMFIPLNLVLSWAGLLLGWYLARQMSIKRWSSKTVVAATIVWLFFLPNTWYTVSDFLHVFSTGEINELYDIALVSTFVFCCVAMGLVSLYSVHNQLLKKLSRAQAYLCVETIILLASFAIYMGRVLRWNSWDAITNSGGLLINISDRLINPLAHPASMNVTGLFFLFISVIYFAFWRAAQIKAQPSK